VEEPGAGGFAVFYAMDAVRVNWLLAARRSLPCNEDPDFILSFVPGLSSLVAVPCPAATPIKLQDKPEVGLRGRWPKTSVIEGNICGIHDHSCALLTVQRVGPRW
jgi:hypothetical protein